jgi:hypothetical protein
VNDDGKGLLWKGLTDYAQVEHERSLTPLMDLEGYITIGFRMAKRTSGTLFDRVVLRLDEAMRMLDEVRNGRFPR